MNSLTSSIHSNQSQIIKSKDETSSHNHWKNARQIIQNFLFINSTIDQLIHDHTIMSQENSQQLNKKLSQIINVNIGIMFFALFFGFFIVYKINKHVVSLTVDLNQNREEADIARNTAEQKSIELDNTSRVLIKTNRNLVDSIENLNNTRDQLVQNEKMAALGELVAGVAHEINTPIGIGVTAASLLQDSVIKFTKKFESGEITKIEFSEFLTDSNEGSRIMLNNLERAAKLISSFKQVAVDQTSEDRRKFNLKETIEETLLSLHPKIKQTKIEIELNCNNDINLDSFPGSYSQIISNLITNSLIHAYQEDDKGTISIHITKSESTIHLAYCDDGKGVIKENRKKLFDPFFTTRRGEGGSGLGLHLIFNIITQKLKGDIKLRDTDNTGLCFDIYLPINLLN